MGERSLTSRASDSTFFDEGSDLCTDLLGREIPAKLLPDSHWVGSSPLPGLYKGFDP